MTDEERMELATRRLGLLYHAYRALDGRVHTWSIEARGREFAASITSREDTMAHAYGHWSTVAVCNLAVCVSHRFASDMRHTADRR